MNRKVWTVFLILQILWATIGTWISAFIFFFATYGIADELSDIRNTVFVVWLASIPIISSLAVAGMTSEKSRQFWKDFLLFLLAASIVNYLIINYITGMFI